VMTPYFNEYIELFTMDIGMTVETACMDSFNTQGFQKSFEDALAEEDGMKDDNLVYHVRVNCDYVNDGVNQCESDFRRHLDAADDDEDSVVVLFNVTAGAAPGSGEATLETVDFANDRAQVIVSNNFEKLVEENLENNGFCNGIEIEVISLGNVVVSGTMMIQISGLFQLVSETGCYSLQLYRDTCFSGVQGTFDDDERFCELFTVEEVNYELANRCESSDEIMYIFLAALVVFILVGCGCCFLGAYKLCVIDTSGKDAGTSVKGADGTVIVVQAP